MSMPIQEYKYHITREQKEAVGLLSIGTFLEYFDLMLYVHMSVLLNELFFPKSDPHTQAIYSSIAFCSTFVFRPIGAILFGWIGDTLGRKTTIVITTFLMSLSCIIMSITPTFAEKGLIATAIVTICRMIQGMSSMGEIIGAKLYLTETVKRPHQYAVLALLNFLAALGGTVALGISSFVMSNNLNWRYVFGIGAIVAITGSIARTTLREVPEFADPKRRLKSIFNKFNNHDTLSIKEKFIWNESVNIRTSIALFCIECAWPVCFYIAFIYLGEVLKSNFNYSPEQIINNNFIVSIFEILGIIPLIFLGYFIYPISILKIRLILFSIFILISPFLLMNLSSPNKILFLQSFIMFFVLDNTPASSIFYSYFPIFKRFTYTSFIYALSRALMYIITSFAFIYITQHFGNWGIIIISTPILCAYIFGVLHFQKLEINTGNYVQKKMF